MVSSIAQLGIEISSQGANQAAADLDRLTQAGAKAEATAGRTGKAWEDAGKKIKKGADDSAKAIAQQQQELSELVGQIDPTIAAFERLDAQQQKLRQFKAAGLIDQADFERFNGRLDQARSGLARFDDSLMRSGNTAKQNAAALRGVPAQFTDIVVSLQAGQAPLTVLLQQGGQLKDMFGGIGPAAKALGGYITGLINPFTLAAAGATALAYGFVAGRQEAVEYNKALILTGGYAGVTADQLSTMARQVSSVVGTTGAASAALATLAGGGKIASGSFVEVAEAAVAMEKATGKAVGDTIAEFNKIADDPVAAAKALDDQYHFLTATIYSQIVALKEQGDTIGAARLLTNTYADTVKTRAGEITENLGFIERGWNAVKSAAAGALDGLKSVGREASLTDQIEDAERRLKIAESGSFDFLGRNKASANAIREQLDMLRSQRDAEADIAAYDKQQAETQDKAKKAMQEVDKLSASALTNEEKRNKALDTYRKQLEDIRKANPNDSRLNADSIAKNEQAIRDQFKDPRTSTRSSPVDLTSYNDAQNALKQLQATYQNAERELEASQRAGLISQAEYTTRRTALIQQEKSGVSAAYQQEIAALEAAKARATTTGEQRIQLDQKIADARTNMVKAQQDADTQLNVLSLNEQARLKKQEESIRTYIDALDQQNKALRDQGIRAAAGVGQGQRQRELNNSLNGIQDSANNKRLELANQYGDGSRGMSFEEYQEKLKAVQASENDLRDTVLQSYADMDDAQRSFSNGASAAWQDYLDNAKDISATAYDLVSNSLTDLTDGIADGFANAVVEGETLRDTMSSLATTIEKEVLSTLVKLGIQYGVNAALEIAGITTVDAAKKASIASTAAAQTAAITTTAAVSSAATAATTAEQTAAAAATTTAWAPAATVASIGSFGTAAAIGLAAVVAALALSKGFRTGGYTGDGGVDDVAGVVHGKEFVFDASSTSRIGVDRLEALRRGESIEASTPAIATSGSAANSSSYGGATIHGGINMSFPGVTNAQEAKRSTAAGGRQIVGALQRAQRYS